MSEKKVKAQRKLDRLNNMKNVKTGNRIHHVYICPNCRSFRWKTLEKKKKWQCGKCKLIREMTEEEKKKSEDTKEV